MNQSNGLIFERSHCPITNMLDLFGDKWTLLIIRDLALGKLRYNELAQSDERMPTNILASRLKRLALEGIITKRIYCEKPIRYDYELTDKGRDLIPVLNSIAEWSIKHVPGVQYFPRYRDDAA